jgi:hypothetical protein
MLSAWLPGMVHGVVVQITVQQSPSGSAASRRHGRRAALGSVEREADVDRGDFLSWYSTSASASAEPQSKHQFTGFRPLKR